MIKVYLRNCKRFMLQLSVYDTVLEHKLDVPTPINNDKIMA
jgi:hypothetical protein